MRVRTNGVWGRYKYKNDRENRKRGYEVQIEGPYQAEKLQNTKGHIQINEQIRVEEAPKKTQE